MPAALLHPIVKPWPFRGWDLDFICQINPPSSKGHHFVLVATDYFTNWAEVVPLKNMTHREVIEFITEHIIHRFGIPQSLTTDQGSSFISKKRYENLSNLTKLRYSIHLHIMLRPMVRPSLVIKS